MGGKGKTAQSYDITPIDNNTDSNAINSLKFINDISHNDGPDGKITPKPEGERKPRPDDEIAPRSESPVDRVKFKGLVEGDNDSVCSVEVRHRNLPAIPDGGWGWVVVLAAFLVSACADGLAFSFGLLHEEFSNYFKATQSETSMIGSLFIATPLIAGPIMSALVDRYGCRVMTMIAAVLSTISFLLASLCNSIPMLCLTFGFMAGLAMGILYVTAVVSVAFWFDKRRNLAVSLASCGIGFGTLVYSPLTHWLLSFYDWRNTIIILAGTLLNMCVCGALMRNPEWLDIKQKEKRRLSRLSRSSSRASSVSSRSVDGDSNFMGAEELKTLLESGESPEYILATLASTIKEEEELEANTEMNSDPMYKRMHSAIHLPTFIQRNDKVPQEVLEKLMENKRLYHIILKNYPELTRRRSENDLKDDKPLADAAIEPADLPIEIKAKKPNTESEKGDGKLKTEKNSNSKVEEKSEASNDTKAAGDDIVKANVALQVENAKPLASKPSWLRQISTDHHYLRDMPLYRNTVMHRGAMMSIPRYKLKASSLPDMYRNSMESLDSLSDDEMKWYNRIWLNTKASFDVKMFTEFHFLMYNLSSLIFSVWFIVPYFFLKSFMTERNIEGEPTMIAIIGVASSIGIVALGWAGDQPWINVTKTYASCMIVCGLSIAAFPLAIASHAGLAVVSVVFGLSLASSYSYTPAILMELMPIDRFTVAYGLILLSQGLGHLIGPPLAGALYDATGNWDMTFYMGGLWLVISGVCIGVIAYTDDRRLCGTAPLLKEAELAEKNENGLAVS